MSCRMLGPWLAGLVALSWARPVVAQDSAATTTLIARFGPAAMILIVTVLGLTITVRSLRTDCRRQRTLDRYWRRGAMARAGRGSRD